MMFHFVAHHAEIPRLDYDELLGSFMPQYVSKTIDIEMCLVYKEGYRGMVD